MNVNFETVCLRLLIKGLIVLKRLWILFIAYHQVVFRFQLLQTTEMAECFTPFNNLKTLSWGATVVKN